MAKVRFVVRSKKIDNLSKIYIRYYENREIDITIPTELRILPKYWNNKSQNFSKRISYSSKFTDADKQKLEDEFINLKSLVLKKSNEGIEINKRSLTKIIYDYHHPGIKAKGIQLNNYIDHFIKQIESGKRLTDKGSKYQYSTVKTYKEFRTQLILYQEKRNIQLNFQDVTIDIYDDMLEFFRNKNLSINTIGKHIKILKRIMRAAHEENLHDSNQYNLRKFKVITADSPSIYLSLDEIQSMYELNLSEKPELELARDVFLIGCFSALRYSDYCRIQPNHIQIISAETRIIKINTKKTRTEVIIPFWHWMLDELIDKYPEGLPKTYEQKINFRIKAIGKLAGIDTPVSKTIYKNGDASEMTVPKYELIMTHTARRSAATNMYKHGIPPIDIMKITGHSKESTFMKYIKQSSEETAERITKQFRINRPLIGVK